MYSVHFAASTHKQCHSPILGEESTFDQLAPDKTLENIPTFVKAALFDDSAECKLSEKRRREANKAEMEERLKTDTQQQTLEEVNQTAVMVKPIPIAATTAAALAEITTLNT